MKNPLKFLTWCFVVGVLPFILIGCTAYIGYIDRNHYHRVEPETKIEKRSSGLETFDRFNEGEFNDEVISSLPIDNEPSRKCGAFVLPDFEETPPLPNIPPEKRNDDGFIANELIDYVQRIIQHQRVTREMIAQAYEEYLDECKQ